MTPEKLILSVTTSFAIGFSISELSHYGIMVNMGIITICSFITWVIVTVRIK
jgi:predicted RND superfamily exporter protein